MSLKEQDFFEKVDGYKNPLALLTDEDLELCLGEKSYKDLRKKTDRHCGVHYNLARGLREYEHALNLMPGGFDQVIKAYSSIVNRKGLSVLDGGCGNGWALREIFALEEVDQDKCIGITLRHPRSYRPEEVEDNMFFGDIAEIILKRRFDILVSVLGAVYYHPMNKNLSHGSTKMFGVLQAINMTKIGGLLCVNTDNKDYVDIAKADTINLLIQEGILRHVTEFDALGRVNNRDSSRVYPLVFIVDRHPSSAEIVSLLECEDGLYEIA